MRRVLALLTTVPTLLAGCSASSQLPDCTGVVQLGLVLPVGLAGNALRGETTRDIVPPMTITNLLYFTDGGTMAVEAIDARGREFAFCFDGMMLSATPERIYFGAVHPTREGAKLIPEGSEDERTILGLLRGWLDARLTGRRQAELLQRRAVTGLPKQEYRALRILRAFRRRYYIRKTRQWLDDNYSPEEQASLLGLPSNEGLGDKERTAWHKVQSLHGYPVRRRKEGARRPARSTDAATRTDGRDEE